MADVYSIVVEFLHKGGFFIYPISLVFVIGLAIALERWIYLQYEKSRNSYAFKDFLPLLREINVEKMRAYTRENSAPVLRVIGCGLDMLDVSRQRADIENAMSEGMLETMPRLEQRTNYLGLLANVATLLGLLGTIIGLIGAFEAVAKADPSEKSQLLSTSISVAMNTTAVGLITAIPLLILNGLLQNKTKAIVTGIEMSAVKFLNVMTMKRQIEAGAPRVSNDGGNEGGLSAAVTDAGDESLSEARPATLKAGKSSTVPLAERLKQAEEAKGGVATQQTATESPSDHYDSAAAAPGKASPTETAKQQDGDSKAGSENNHKTASAEQNGVQIPISPSAGQTSGVSFSQASAITDGVQISSTVDVNQQQAQDIVVQVNTTGGMMLGVPPNSENAESTVKKS